MAVWFWEFLFFSFLGYLLEKLYAALTKAEKQNRKSFFLLPLCPVYGLSVMLALYLYQWGVPFAFLLLLPTVVEYALHFYYETVYHVEYWSYRKAWGNLRGRISLPFSLCWAALLPPALFLARRLFPFFSALPPAAGYAAWLVFSCDFIVSRLYLLDRHDTEALHIKTLFL